MFTLIHKQQYQFSSVIDRFDCRGDMRDDSAETTLPVFSVGGHCEQVWHGHGYIVMYSDQKISEGITNKPRMYQLDSM